eukprot:CAMPEP_0206125582 /NCGR_PEP_ID=MMETSP1472-20131121/17947_1 /ASSEMBLY_ACC=CAM_ASM_001108 /TAXON_ID=41880 /ORGANISM="Pycnococcus provasolii, Strain RCC251" /LENGTH=56 /DNA_ID=CAMNT_0053516517 /DNA_START=251 /DNA_END=418 /DNA_ORIENTATION=+
MRSFPPSSSSPTPCPDCAVDGAEASIEVDSAEVDAAPAPASTLSCRGTARIDVRTS